MNEHGATAFLGFAEQVAAAARERAGALGCTDGRELRFAVDFLLTVRCSVAAGAAGALTDEEVEDVRAFLELEQGLTLAGIGAADDEEELADAVMRGSDGLHSFLLAHDLLEPYCAYVDAEGEFIDLLVYGRDDWRTEHAEAARARGRAARLERRAAARLD